MYCSECGKPAERKFCAHCGAPLDAQAANGEADSSPEPPIDWENEVRYAVLMRIPQVRDLIAKHAARAKPGLTGEQILGIVDSVMSTGIPMEKVSKLGQSLGTRLGIKMSRQREAIVPFPPGRVLLRALCSMARKGQTVLSVQQGDDGCCIQAKLPSDLFALEGTLSVTVRRHPEGTQFLANTLLQGQWMDWGKSNRCLDALVSDVHAWAA